MEIVIVGGGVCGLAAAVMLADDGHRIHVLERDPAPPPPEAEQSSAWERPSVAQFGLAHWMHARGTAILRHHAPRVVELLEANGALRFNILDGLLADQSDVPPDPEDRRFDALTGRRCLLEWAAATAADEHPLITVERGRVVDRLLADEAPPDGVPHVRGVRLSDGDERRADLVIDCSGRRSQVMERLAGIGARAPMEDNAEHGFVYNGRYFRSPDGTIPAMRAPLLGPHGSFSILTLPADSGTWSVTLYALASDRELRSFRDPEVFERVVRACPGYEHWLDGEPITGMYSMAGGVDRYRRFVADGVPSATGLLVLADAASCTNPSLGRGMTLGLIHAEILRECVASHGDDPEALAEAFDAGSETRLHPFHQATVDVDRARVAEMLDARSGVAPPEPSDPPAPPPLAAVLGAAAKSDPVAARAFAAIFTCTELASDALARPGVVAHLQELASTVSPAPLPGPDRHELVTLAGR